MSSSKSRSLSPKEILQFADDIPKLHRRHKDKAKFLRQLRLYLHSISNNVKKQKAFLSTLNPNVSTSLSVDKMMEALWDDSATTFEVGGGFNWGNALISGALTGLVGIGITKFPDTHLYNELKFKILEILMRKKTPYDMQRFNLQQANKTISDELERKYKNATWNFATFIDSCQAFEQSIKHPHTQKGLVATAVAAGAATGHFTRKPKVNKLLRKRSSSSTRRRQRRSPSNK